MNPPINIDELESREELYKPGLAYGMGDNVDVDEHISPAVQLLQKRTKKGNVDCAVVLALFYQEGDGRIAKNEMYALQLLEKASSTGKPKALLFLSQCFKKGMGFRKTKHVHKYSLGGSGGGSAPLSIAYDYRNGNGMLSEIESDSGEVSSTSMISRQPKPTACW